MNPAYENAAHFPKRVIFSVERIYQQFKDHFSSKREKRPKGIAGLAGVYSLKRLSEAF